MIRMLHSAFRSMDGVIIRIIAGRSPRRVTTSSQWRILAFATVVLLVFLPLAIELSASDNFITSAWAAVSFIFTAAGDHDDTINSTASLRQLGTHIEPNM